MRFNHEAFAFNGETQTYIAEASTLGMRPGMSPPQQFTINIDSKTTKQFYFSKPDLYAGELTGWYYNGHNGFRALIIND